MIFRRNLFIVFAKATKVMIDFWGHRKVTTFLEEPTNFRSLFGLKNPAYIMKLSKSLQKVYQFLMLNLVWDV